MSFEIQPLEATVSFDGADVISAPIWLDGKGQKIYWKGCVVKVYNSCNKFKAIALHTTCDGQAIVPEGTDVFLGNKGGLIKIGSI